MNKLKLTNGTDTVNFLSGNEYSGVRIFDWTPEIATYKDQGVTTSSPLTDGRRLVMKRWEWPVESVDFVIYGASKANVISKMRQIDELLLQAANYWDESHHEGDPVWVEMRADGESASRYALVLNGSVVGRPNPFAQPYGQPDGGSSTGVMTLNILRTHWQDQIPGNVSDNVAQLTMSYSSPSSLSQPGAEEWVYIGNYHNPLYNIDSITTYGAGGTGLWTSAYDTLTDYFVDWTVGDYIEFISDDPFYSVALDVGNPASTPLGLRVDYYNSDLAGWYEITESDGTFGMTQPGVISWDFDRISSPTFPAHEVTRVRIVLTATNGVGSSPGRKNSGFREFSPNRSYVTIPSATAGDIQDVFSVSLLSYDYAQRVYAGSRQTARGSGFESTVNLTNVSGYSPAHITVTADSASFTSTFKSSNDLLSVATSGTAPVYGSTTLGGESTKTDMFTVTIDSAYLSEWQGKYRAFVRLITDESGGEDYSIVRMDLEQNIGPSGYNAKASEAGVIAAAGSDLYSATHVDFGIISILDQKVLPVGSTADLSITLRAWRAESASTPKMAFLELVLIPVDEMYFEHDVDFTHNVDPNPDPLVYVADSAVDPSAYALYYLEDQDGTYLGPIPKPVDRQLAFESGQEANLYFFIVQNDQTTPDTSREIAHGVKVKRVKRYLYLR